MRRVMVAAAIVATTVALTGGVAWAAEIEVSPAEGEEAGPADFEITLTDFEPDTPVFVLPCEVPESGDPADVDGETCDPPGEQVGPAGQECRSNCTFCGDGILDQGGNAAETIPNGGLDVWNAGDDLDQVA